MSDRQVLGPPLPKPAPEVSNIWSLDIFDQEALNISESSPPNGYAVPLHLNWRAFWSLNGYAEVNRTRTLLLYENVTKRLFEK